MFPVLFFISKLGTTCSYGAVYIGNTEVFPEEVAASTMGICQVMARIISTLQFFFMQMEQPLPMIIFTGGAAVATICSLLLRNTGKEINLSGKKDIESYTRVE